MWGSQSRCHCWCLGLRQPFSGHGHPLRLWFTSRRVVAFLGLSRVGILEHGILPSDCPLACQRHASLVQYACSVVAHLL